ncbi:GMC family oxidoreductase [Parvularcula flava]|uniref:GMC family oxidoreductase n=1 Tax=Aquisalinus luteolus TaxID=1566827 RepID=A0A8J3A011_9PROT|nr:GMC family oxidoreductase [Aquisalinus luteolus]NHK26299.1 GMC family oxidoreductase [Aquisalinus luteolus]GGH91911.1 GMC family oxidoreductase [Aquisalinus luteolus]
MDFDAIVVGSGMTGGIAAKELCERGLKVLVIERGRHLDHPSPEYTDDQNPWEIENRGLVSEIYDEQGRYRMLKAKGWTYRPEVMQFFVDEKEHPYSFPPERPFMWTRGYHLGGRSLTWSRQVYRWSARDFEANARDGYGVDWPIRYDDLAPWYDHVENFVGIAGNRDGVDSLPDGDFLPPWELSAAERKVIETLRETMPDWPMVGGRCANLSEPRDHHSALGRGRCQARDLCMRGCSYGAYFSSLSASLPAARRTGLLTVESDQVVHSVEVDPATGRASGVNVIGAGDKSTRRFEAPIIFLCASAVASTQIMLNSVSERHPRGLGNQSDALGRYVMDHFSGAGASGHVPGIDELYAYGRKPNGILMPNYMHRHDEDLDFVRGYCFQGGARERGTTGSSGNRRGIGREAKERDRQTLPWRFGFFMSGETLPYKENRITLHPTEKDKWGIPVVHVDAQVRENERRMIVQAEKDARRILEAAGCTDIDTWRVPEDEHIMLGGKTHEMGGAPMGRDPGTSVLNGWNQVHSVPNLFVTDGACMASCGSVNPSLTYMAITARAAHHAADLRSEGRL